MKKILLFILLLIIGLLSYSATPVSPSSPYIFKSYVKVLLDSLVTQGVAFESRDTFIKVPTGRIGMCFKNDTLFIKLGSTWKAIQIVDSAKWATIQAMVDSLAALQDRLLDSISASKPYIGGGFRWDTDTLKYDNAGTEFNDNVFINAKQGIDLRSNDSTYLRRGTLSIGAGYSSLTYEKYANNTVNTISAEYAGNIIQSAGVARGMTVVLDSNNLYKYTGAGSIHKNDSTLILNKGEGQYETRRIVGDSTYLSNGALKANNATHTFGYYLSLAAVGANPYAYTGTDIPTGATRLNINGKIYATELNSQGIVTAFNGVQANGVGSTTAIYGVSTSGYGGDVSSNSGTGFTSHSNLARGAIVSTTSYEKIMAWNKVGTNSGEKVFVDTNGVFYHGTSRTVKDSAILSLGQLKTVFTSGGIITETDPLSVHKADSATYPGYTTLTKNALNYLKATLTVDTTKANKRLYTYTSIQSDSNVWYYKPWKILNLLFDKIGGSGTINTFPIFSGTKTLGNSNIAQTNDSVITINSTVLIKDSAQNTLIIDGGSKSVPVGAGSSSGHIQLFLKNTRNGGLVNGQDYPNEVHLRLQAGTTADHRAYINWSDYAGVDKWILGRNAGNTFVLYDQTGAHRMFFLPNSAAYLNSCSTAPVYINHGDNDGDTYGTGGFQVWSGGVYAGRLAMFTVSSYTATDASLKSISNGSGYAPASLLLQSNQNTGRGQGIWMFNNVNKGQWFAGVPYQSTSYTLGRGRFSAFNPNGGMTTYTLVTIDTLGKMGIGVLIPMFSVDVNKSIRVRNRLLFGGNSTDSTTTTGKFFSNSGTLIYQPRVNSDSIFRIVDANRNTIMTVNSNAKTVTFSDSIIAAKARIGTSTNNTTISATGSIDLKGSATITKNGNPLNNTMVDTVGSDGLATINMVSSFRIGQLYGGGIIFFMDSTGKHGLICAPRDVDTAKWSMASGALGTTDYWDGQSNSNEIMAQSGHVNSSAAYKCDTSTMSGHTDWYLPAVDQFRMILANRYIIDKTFDSDGNATTIKLTETSAYWTSTEYNSVDGVAVIANFIGTITDYDKQARYYVRAIRNF
jgi:hypothetical protein